MIEDLYSNYTNNYRTNSPIRNGFISEQETYLANEDSKQHVKIRSVSHIIRELQMKTMRKYCTTIKTAELKRKK